MRRLSIPFTIALILIGALGRLHFLRTSALSLSDLQQIQLAIRPKLLDASQRLDPSLQTLGIERLEFQRFDPGAVVLMRPGKDGQPGVAGVDDDRNGTIDDRSELGATYSDDVCSVEPSDANQDEEATLVLQYGAFVPSSPAERNPQSTQPMRAVVFGESPGHDRWSFLVEMDELAVRQ